ncbi:MAG: cyclopropane-fatty-acyl-phospholipid synthase family protein [Pseudohongiellaceae bacterium]
MRITIYDEPGITRASSDFIANWARKLVLKLFSKIAVGSLTIEDGGQVYQFGEDQHQAKLVAHVKVKHTSAYMAVLRNGSMGAGEAYMAGLWESPDLLQVVRLMVLNMTLLESMDNGSFWWRRLADRLFNIGKRNNRSGARRNIAAHYDLSNDFFALFLDETMAYSAAIFNSKEQSLELASRAKFQHICERLQLQPDDHLVEIGTGWGGLAIHAARHFGCRVTTTTLSHQQYLYASAWVKHQGLEDQITVLEKDYRDLDGKYDKLVSVEMIEAVGSRFYPEYFRKCCSLLRDDGLMLLQSITISDQRYPKSVKSMDFIKRYIFPGGQLPSNSVIASQVARNTDMQIIGLEDITHDYARTLQAWRERFWQRVEEVRKQDVDEVFIRMWHFYLCFCEGGFRERVIHTAQILMARPAFRNLPPVGQVAD